MEPWHWRTSVTLETLLQSSVVQFPSFKMHILLDLKQNAIFLRTSERGGVESRRVDGTGRVWGVWGVRLRAQPVASLLLPGPSILPCIRCTFNYASFSALIRDLQTALKISSFRAYFVLVNFLSELKEEDNGIKPYTEAREWAMEKISGADAMQIPPSAHPCG